MMNSKDAILAVRKALDEGCKVAEYGNYRMIKDKVGQYLITSGSGMCMGLSGKPGTIYEWEPNFQPDAVTVDGVSLEQYATAGEVSKVDAYKAHLKTEMNYENEPELFDVVFNTAFRRCDGKLQIVKYEITELIDFLENAQSAQRRDEIGV